MILRRGSEETVRIRLGAVELEGLIDLPDEPHGVVLFAHGSGSSRWSPRNQFVAHQLREAGLGTVLVDLMTAQEDQNASRWFEIPFLTQRLARITDWLRARLSGTRLRIGYFGSSTGAAAALQAAIDQGEDVGAIVSRGGRPDLVDDVLQEVPAPTLLIVGGNDEPVTSLNVMAYRKLRSPKELAVIPGATHLFEEPGALDQVARLAADWFRRFLPLTPPSIP
jgi:putative phosphoribosyl transferase